MNAANASPQVSASGKVQKAGMWNGIEHGMGSCGIEHEMNYCGIEIMTSLELYMA